MTRLLPCSILFPYTTLFRSLADDDQGVVLHEQVEFVELDLFDRIPVHRRFEDDEEDIVVAVDLGSLIDRKSTRLNSSHVASSYAVFCLKKKINIISHDKHCR